MELKITTNFDFGKLADKMDNIIEEYVEGYIDDSVKGTKANIDAGLRDIGKVAKFFRRYDGYPEKPPLKASGKLYNSIKRNDNSLEMEYYGKDHHDGFRTHRKSRVPNVWVKARPFISTSVDNTKKLDQSFMISINKSLKK